MTNRGYPKGCTRLPPGSPRLICSMMRARRGRRGCRVWKLQARKRWSSTA